ATAVVRVGARVGLVEVSEAVEAVLELFAEYPPVFIHDGIHHDHRQSVRQALQRAEDQRAVRPRAGERDIKAIASGLGANRLPRKGVAEGGARTEKLARGLAGVMPPALPHAICEKAGHDQVWRAGSNNSSGFPSGSSS